MRRIDDRPWGPLCVGTTLLGAFPLPPRPLSTPVADPESLFRLRSVAKRYPAGGVALEGLDLDASRGDFLAIVGPSGCGKSTALRLVAGLSEPSAGEIEWPHESVEDPAAGVAKAGERPDVGFVFQDPTLMPWSRVWGNVYLPLRLRGVSRRAARERVDDALRLVGLTDAARVYPRELSGGMRMRVAIARALVTRPRVLLMDEPFAALDEITRFKLNDDLLGLWREFGWTVVFVTHSVFEAVYLARRVVVMASSPGRVVADVPIEGPGPRTAAFRATPEFAAQCATVSEALRVATVG